MPSSQPKLNPEDIVYQEYFASGCSYKNFLTKLGGASGCLRLVVTKDLLWITSWMPMSLITSFYDLEHVIPLNSILDVQRRTFVIFTSFQLTYQDTVGNRHTLRLFPMRPTKFFESLGLKLPD